MIEPPIHFFKCRLRHDRLMKNRAKQAEGAVTASVQPPSPGAFTAPAPVDAVASSFYSPDPGPAFGPSKPAPKSTNVTPPTETPITVINDQLQTSAGPPNLTAPAVARPRPRPRPVYKGKGKEKADAHEGIERSSGVEHQTEQMHNQSQIKDTNANMPGIGVETATELLSEAAQGVERRSVEVQAPGRGKKRSDRMEGSLSSGPLATADVSTELGRQPRRSVRKKQKIISEEEKVEGESEACGGGPQDSGMERGAPEEQDSGTDGTLVGAYIPGSRSERGRGRGRGRGGGKRRKGGRDGGIDIASVGGATEEI